MARKNRTPEEKARREKIRELLQMANIGSMDDIQNLFKETIAEFMENGLEAELEDELGYSRYDYRNKATDNSRNGHSSKTLRTSFGDVEVSVPRDRKGEFEPQVLKKNQTSISQDIEEKILSMYAKGMTTGDIEAHIQDIYGICVSDSTVSRITDKILPIVREWQQRPLEGIYAVVFLDAIHYHVRSEGQIVKKAVYIAIGIDLNGRKDVLGMWVGENESAKFWATVLNGLKNRGVEDIFIACTDNLTGFDAAIHASFPQTEIQNCILHQLRNSSRYVSYKDIRALMADLKAVYAAVDEQAALNALDAFGERWDGKYPRISQSWRANWANLSTYFKYPQEVRRLDLYHQCHRGFQPPAAQGGQGQIGVSHRRQPVENAVSGDDGHHEKVDGTAAGLERDPRTAVDLLCRTHARITPPEPDVKGLRAAVRGAPMNGGLAATLDIHPRRRYTAHKAAVG